MLKKVHISGVIFNTALVILGWTSFIDSFFVESSIAMFLLKVIARVLP